MSLSRRRFIGLATSLLGGASSIGALLASATLRAGEMQPLRVGLTPAFLHDRHALLAQWQTYLEHRLGRAVDFIQRDSYSDTMNLIRQRRLDVAWLCDYPYVLMKPEVDIVAVPLYQGRPYYRSYLIVPSRDARTASMADLEGKVFAFADPYSNTGYLAPRHEILQLGKNPASFFRRTFFTWSHRKVIEAVASGLADAAAVDSYIWESLQRVEPELTQRTRIVSRSREFGFPPFVARRGVPAADFKAVQAALVDMAGDVEGHALLNELHLDGFTTGTPQLYDDVEEMVRTAGHVRDAAF